MKKHRAFTYGRRAGKSRLAQALRDQQAGYEKAREYMELLAKQRLTPQPVTVTNALQLDPEALDAARQEVARAISERLVRRIDDEMMSFLRGGSYPPPMDPCALCPAQIRRNYPVQAMATDMIESHNAALNEALGGDLVDYYATSEYTPPKG